MVINIFLQELLDELRSDKYLQTIHELKSAENCFCVEGLACEVFIRHNSDEFSFVLNEHEKPMLVDHEGISYNTIPDRIRGWFGLSTTYKVEHDNRSYTLYDLNDTLRLSFAQIADIIQETYEQSNSTIA